MSEIKTVELDIELLTDVCFSTSNRTLGEPETHTCIPGRTLWGAAASRAYRCGMSDTDAFRIFHQGVVRIQDAVPVHGSHRAYPTPRAWHRPKAPQATRSDVAMNFASVAVRKDAAGVQCKPLEAPWVAPDGSDAVLVEVKTSRSTRTSMDASGTPRDGLLFGIPVVLAGTRFWTAISGPAADVDMVAEHLVSGDVRVGRSRNSEMGLIRVTKRTTPIGALGGQSGSASTVSFLCASRCLLRDRRTGSPTTLPFPEAFGLDGDWRFSESSSFIRTARIVHFNAKRARPESDRFALERGSVVTFTSAQATDLEVVKAHVRGGVGEHTGQGYGEVVVCPTWLTAPDIRVSKSEPVPSSGGVAPPKDDLFKWAQTRSTDRRRSVDLYRAAHDHAREMRKYGVPPAQWGALHKYAREARFLHQEKELLRLFEAGGYFDSGARKLSPKWKKAKVRLKDLCATRSTTDLPLFLEHLAGACMRETAESEVRS